MPAANYAPIAGKFGAVVIGGSINAGTGAYTGGTRMNLSEHEIRATGDDIDTTHFESDTSAPWDGTGRLVFGEGLVGIVDAEIMVRGQYDGFNNPFMTPFFLFPGLYGNAFLGLTKSYGFSVGYRCLSTPISTTVRGAAKLESRLKSNGLLTPPTANLISAGPPPNPN